MAAGGTGWRGGRSAILWTLSIGQLVSWGLVYYTFPLFVLPMEAELGWSRNALYGALSAGLLVAGLCAIPVGAWIDRGHGRLLMTGGSVLAAVMLALWGRVDSLPLFYLIWIGIGVSQAAILYEPAFAVITRVFGPDYKRAILLMTFIGGLASTFGIPLAQILVDRIGWRATLDVLALLTLAVGLLIHLPLVPGPAIAAVPIADVPATAVSASERGPLREAMGYPAFWGLVIAFAGYGLAFSAMSFHLIPVLQERKVDTVLIMAVIALIGPMQVLGRMVLMAGQRHIGTVSLGALIYLAFPVSMALLASGISSWPWLIVFAVIYGVANGLVTILRGMSVPEFIGPRGYGVVSGALTMPTNIMRAAGPIAAALGWSVYSAYAPVLWTLAGIMVIAASGFGYAAIAARRRTRHRE